MRPSNETKSVYFVSCFILLSVFALYCLNITFETIHEDIYFLYNRCYQMVDCLKHGLYPFLYYNDFSGVGYASSIFYGQLSLVPFVPFLGSMSLFYKMYVLAFLLLNFFGFRCFAQRYTGYGTLSACFYIVSLPFITLSLGLPAFNMAVGCSWFFLAYCVDFFRDGHGLSKVVLLYFLVWQCNFNGAAIALFACIALFVRYFSLSRWRDYIRLFLSVFVVLLYNLYNMATHMDALRLADNPGLFVGERDCMYYIFSLWPFGGWSFRFLAHDLVGDFGCGFMQFSMVLLFGWLLWRNRPVGRIGLWRRSGVVIAVACAVGYIFGLWTIWPNFYRATEVFFQFPIRYFIFLFGFLLVWLCRHLKQSRVVFVVLVVCVLDMFIANPFVAISNHGETDFFSRAIGWGEYAGASFTYDMEDFQAYYSSVHSESGREYAYSNEYNGLIVDCSANDGVDTITVPKLYYRGYEASGENGEVFSLTAGYSNFCQIDIGSYQGSLRLEYHVSFVTWLLLALQVACVLRLLWLVRREVVSGGEVQERQ